MQKLLLTAGASNLAYELIADEATLLKAKLSEILALEGDKRPQLIITSGGTGIASRDIAPETILSLGGREIPGIGELLRLYGSKFTQFSWGSRSLAVVVERCLVIALPGSSNAVREGVECLLPLLSHLVKMAEGANHD